MELLFNKSFFSKIRADRMECPRDNRATRAITARQPRDNRATTANKEAAPLRIHAGYDVAFDCSQPAPMLLQIAVHHRAVPLHEHSGALRHRLSGDMGMPPPYSDGDFSGPFETYLGVAWHFFDARHNVPRIGRILIARSRDATDCAISTSFGSALLAGFTVITEELPVAQSGTAGDAAVSPNEFVASPGSWRR